MLYLQDIFFYLGDSLLDIVVKEQKHKISWWEIIAGMLSESWYPIHYSHISFGKLDSTIAQSMALQQLLDIPDDANKDDIKRLLMANLDRVKDFLRVFILNVPYRFLSPWITYTSDAEVVEKSRLFHNNCLYALKGETVELNPVWMDYLNDHYDLLRNFAFRNLAVFLQKRNPDVSDILSKLIKCE